MNSMKLLIPLHFISWKKRLQMMLWHHNARVNSHQRWKQTRFCICFHLCCELTNTMNVTEWQVSWNSWFDENFFCFHCPTVKWNANMPKRWHSVNTAIETCLCLWHKTSLNWFPHSFLIKFTHNLQYLIYSTFAKANIMSLYGATGDSIDIQSSQG